MSTSDAERSGRAPEITTPEMIEKNMMIKYRRLKVCDVSEAMASRQRVDVIFCMNLFI